MTTPREFATQAEQLTTEGSLKWQTERLFRLCADTLFELGYADGLSLIEPRFAEAMERLYDYDPEDKVS